MVWGTGSPGVGRDTGDRENASKDSALQSWGRVDGLGEWSTLRKSMTTRVGKMH